MTCQSTAGVTQLIALRMTGHYGLMASCATGETFGCLANHFLVGYLGFVGSWVVSRNVG